MSSRMAPGLPPTRPWHRSRLNPVRPDFERRWWLKRRLVVLLLALALAPAPRPVIAGEGENYIVVVNASNDVSEISQDLLARIFLRKVRSWRGGRAAVPV